MSEFIHIKASPSGLVVSCLEWRRVSHAAHLNVRLCGFYVIQATPDGVSLEKVHGAKKQVPREDIVRFSSVLGRHRQISCQGRECA